jgi:tRNA dimethylallyltransferase
LLDGIAPIPPVDPAIREEVRSMDAASAHAALSREDPAAAAPLNPADTTRNQRALEVIRSTERSILAWRAERQGGIGHRIAADIRIVDPPVEELYARCDARVAAMFEAGTIEEVKALAARALDPDLPIMRAIGVRPIQALLAGAATLDETIETIRQQTRNYAKRQRTWFRNQALIREIPGKNG